MATKFYLLNEAAPYTPPAWQGGWDIDGTITRAMDPHKFGSTSTTATRAEATATTPYKMGVLRLVGRRLAAQTISGTVDVVFGVNESNADSDFYTRLHLYVVNAADGSVVGTLLNGYEESSGGGGTEWPTTNTGRALQGAQALSSVIVPNDGGDYRIVAEIGVVSYNSHATSRTATVRYGARPSTVGPAHSDLTAASTSTSTLAGFIEFSGTVSLASDVVPHLTPEDALEITAFPFSQTFSVHDTGYTYTVWGKYTGQTDVDAVSVFARGEGGSYEPITSAYVNGLSEPVNTPDIANDGDAPVQFRTTLGTDYYLRHRPNSTSDSPANLTVSAERLISQTALGGGIVVLDDSFRGAAILSSTEDYTVLAFKGMAPGEAGDVLPSGVMAVENVDDGTVDVYAADFSLLAQVAINSQTLVGSIRANPTLNRFFAISKTPNPDQIVAITPAGAIETTYTITGVNNLRAIAVSNDESILYYSTDSGDTKAVKRWDLDAGSALSDLVNLGGSGTTGVADIIVLSDGTILANFFDFSVGAIVRHFAADGTLLHTYDYADSDERFPEGTPPRIARAADDPASFWLWRHKDSEPGISTFLNIRISDGAVLTTRKSAEFELGSYEPGATSSPLADFGNSYSCPFFVIPSCPTVDTLQPFDVTAAGAQFRGTMTGAYANPQQVCTQSWFEWAETIADPPRPTPKIRLDPDSWPNPAFTLEWARPPGPTTTYVYRAVTSHCVGVVESSCPIAYGPWVEFTMPALEGEIIGPLTWVHIPQRIPDPAPEDAS